MRKIMLLVLILVFCLMLFVFMGCGKTNPGGGGTNVNTNTNTNVNSNSNFTITVTPAIGAANVNSNTNLTIIFSNPVDRTNLPTNIEGFISANIMSGEADMTALSPTGESITLTWSQNNTNLVISGIETWLGFDIDINTGPRYVPPSTALKVHIIHNGGINDIYGQSLSQGQTIWNYDLGDEDWRYFPLWDGAQTIFQVNQTDADLDPGDFRITQETWTFIENSGYTGYASMELMEINTVEVSGPYYAIAKNDRSYGYFNWEIEKVSISEFPGIKFIKFPLPKTGTNTWTQHEYFDSEDHYYEYTIMPDTISTYLGPNIPCYMVTIYESEDQLDWELETYFWFSYNRGIIKYQEYDNDTDTWCWTSEAVSYTRPF